MRRAIILSAGLGSRLRPLTKEWPKCLTEIHGKSILWNMLESLQRAGVNETTIVVGYLQEKIRASIGESFLGMKIHYVLNSEFEQTNTSYSLLLGIESLNYALMDTILVLEGDVFFDHQLVEKILEDEGENVTLVEKYSPDLDGSFVEISENFVTAWVHKTRRPDKFHLEEKFKTINIHKFTGFFVHEQLVPTIDAYMQRGERKAPMEFIMNDIVSSNAQLVQALLPTPLRWYEIDNMEELTRAEQIFSQNL